MRRISAFLRDTRAGATAIVAATIAVMSMAAGGFLIDHVWLVHQRDLLKSAADSASIAATTRLHNLSSSLSDAEVDSDLRAVAERYVTLNVEANSDRDSSDLELALTINRDAGLVDVRVTDPDLGSTLMEAFHGYAGPDSVTVRSGANLDFDPVWVVLAIDVSTSMYMTLDDNSPGPGESSRMEIVQDAVIDFLSVVTPSEEHGVHIGIVQWSRQVWQSLAPTFDRGELDRVVRALRPYASGTASSVGLERGRTLLASAPEDRRRILILLTDGEDNRGKNGIRCDRSTPNCAEQREQECTAAKDAGITIYTIAAMHPDHVSGSLGQELRECATSEDHAFLNHHDVQALMDTFGEIGGKIRSVRRTH